MNLPLHHRLLSLRLWLRVQQASHTNPLYERAAFRHNVRPAWFVTVLSEITELLFASPLAMVTFPLLPLVLMVVNTVNGLRLALVTSTAINHERERHTLELLTLIPPGKNEALWLVCLGAIHGTRAYQKLTLWRRYIHRMIPVTLSVYVLLLLLNLLPDSGFALTFRNGLFFLVIVPAVVAVLLDRDNTQSVVTAALVGLVAGTASRKQDNARAIALMTFAGVQVAVYAALFFALSLPLRGLFPLQNVTTAMTWGLLLLKATAYLVIITTAYILLRDAVVRLLWWLLQRLLHTA